MKIIKILQSQSDENPLTGIDLLICGCGYEERSTALLQYYGDTVKNVAHRFALAYTDPQHEKLDDNRRVFCDFGFNLIDISGSETLFERITIFSDILNNVLGQNVVNLLLDYSSMSREWYGAFILLMEKINKEVSRTVNCLCYYTIPEYEGEKDDKFSIADIKPLSGFSNLMLPFVPLSLVVGLGSEDRVLNGIKQFTDVDSSYVHYYYTNNQHTADKPEYKKLFNNANVLNKHEYSLSNMVPVFNSLCDLYQMTKDESRMTIVSCGPKPFTFLSLIFARIYSVDVWKLETNLSDHYVQKKPTKDSVRFFVEYG